MSDGELETGGFCAGVVGNRGGDENDGECWDLEMRTELEKERAGFIGVEGGGGN